MVQNSQKEKCPRCTKSNMFTDSETAEVICGSCGFVLNERLESSGPEYRNFFDGGPDKSRTGTATSITRHDMGLATIINPANRDASGKMLSTPMKLTLGRLRIWDNRSQSTPADRNLRDAFNELYKMKDKLTLSDAVVEKAAYIYRKALDKKLVRGRSILTMISAALYIACRDTETPRTLKDIIKVTNVSKKNLSACYRMLVNEFDLKVPVVDSVQCLSRIASKVGISEKIKRDAILILRKAEQQKISAGKNPMGLAATALYLSCLKNGENFTQRDIAEASDVTEVTLRNRLKGLKNIDL